VIGILALLSLLQSILLDEIDWDAPLIKLIAVFYQWWSTVSMTDVTHPASGLQHFYSGSVRHHRQTFASIVEFVLDLGSEILIYHNRGRPLIVWIDSYDNVSVQPLLSFLGCSVLHLHSFSYVGLGAKLHHSLYCRHGCRP
jgi:hypothetical protein